MSDEHKLFSTECGADYWLEFDINDDPRLQALNGKCVVIVSSLPNDMKETDEYDPCRDMVKEPYKLLVVHKSKLKCEDLSVEERRARRLASTQRI